MSGAIFFRALVGLKSFNSQDTGDLKRAIQGLRDLGFIEKISSIYRQQGFFSEQENIHNLREERLYEALSCVVKMQMEGSLRESFRDLQILEQKHRGGASHGIKAYFLAFEEESYLTPQLTIPHPELHLSPEWLIASSEVWPTYHHPILKTEMQALCVNVKDPSWGKFYASGKSLLDF